MPTRHGAEKYSSSSNLVAQLEREAIREYFGPGIQLKDRSVDSNVIIAGRPKVNAKLVSCLALDLDIVNFDIDTAHDLLATCSGRVVYLFKLSTLALIDQFGRVDGGAHKGNVRDISIDGQGQYIASAGEDKRIAIWNIKTKVSEKTFEAHGGIIFQIEFTADNDNVISCSEDGQVLIWDWRTGDLLRSFMKHSSSVRTFDFNYDVPSQIFCGRTDGHVTVWNVDHLLRMDDINPEPEWQENATEESLLGWQDVTKRHSGGILCVRVAPNGWIMATGSSDHTCKVWNIISYKKEIGQVQAEILNGEESLRELNSRIDILSPKYDYQTNNMTDHSILMAGEVSLTTGYHADLLLTLRHDAAVLSICFSPNSAIIATGSADATCRLWSSWKGDLLFHIDTPAPINSLYMTEDDILYCSCQSRLLSFEYNVKLRDSAQTTFVPTAMNVYATKKEETPMTLPRSALRSRKTPKIMPTIGEVEENERQKSMIQVPPRRTFDTIEEEGEEPSKSRARSVFSIKNEYVGFQPTDLEETAEEPLREVTVNELKQLVSHGLLKPSAFESIVANTEDVNADQLSRNMTKFGIQPNQVIRLMTNNNIAPDDILQALSKKTTEVSVLCSMITRNTPIAGYMNRLGYSDSETPVRDANKRRSVIIKKMDLEKPERRSTVVNRSGDAFDYSSWWNSYWSDQKPAADAIPEEELSPSESDDSFEYENAMEEPMVNPPNPGSILHFVPSMQMKLLKDLQAQRKIQPIFLRQILMESETGTRYPNFRPEDGTADFKPSIIKINKLDRFNEASKLAQTSRRFTTTLTRTSSFASTISKRRGSMPDELQKFKEPLKTMGARTKEPKSQPRARSKSIPNLSMTGQRQTTFEPFGNRALRSPTALEELARMSPTTLAGLQSSKVFQPDRYIKSKGLRVTFGKDAKGRSRSMSPIARAGRTPSPERPGHIYATRTVVRSSNERVCTKKATHDQRATVDLLVHNRQKYKESTID